MRAFTHIGYSRSPMPARTAARPLDPRKTPAQTRSAATVAAVLEAAARILETEGLDGYTTNAVARRAGVSIGSLYQYFPGKDAVTRALIVRETAALLVEVAAIGTEATGRAGLERLIGVAVAHQLRRPALARLLDLEERRLPVDVEMRGIGDRLTSAFQGCLAAPDMAAMPRTPLAAEDLLAIVKGLVDAAGERGERDSAGLLARVGRAVFGYLEYTAV